MNSVERAKVFLARGKRLAMTVVPFAAMAVTANAIAIVPPTPAFNPTSGPAIEGRSGGALTCSGCVFQTSALPMFNNLIGVKVYGSGTGTMTNAGYISLMTGGNFTGSPAALPDSFPVQWNFTLTLSRDASLWYGVWLGINNATGGFQYANFQPSENVAMTAGVPVNISGSGMFTGAAAVTNPNQWNLALNLSWGGLVGDTFTLTIPQNSVDINSAVPEPASLLLIGPALALLLLKRARAARR